jgi:hypothetical protein
MSIEEISKLDFSKYPFFDKDYNAYCKKFNSFKTLYNHMLNGFENSEIISILNDNLKIYFEFLDKNMINNLKLIEGEASKKQ